MHVQVDKKDTKPSSAMLSVKSKKEAMGSCLGWLPWMHEAGGLVREDPRASCLRSLTRPCLNKHIRKWQPDNFLTNFEGPQGKLLRWPPRMSRHLCRALS